MKALMLLCIFMYTTQLNQLYAHGTSTTPETDTTLFLSIEDAFFISGAGAVVTGTIETGTAIPGMKVEIVGKGDKRYSATIGFINMYTKQVASAKAGESVSINLRGVEVGDLKRGMAVAAPNSITTSSKITATISMLPEKDGTTFTVKPGIKIQLLNRAESESATIDITEDQKPGYSGTVTITLSQAIVFRKNDKITFKNAGKIIGSGVVTKL